MVDAIAAGVPVERFWQMTLHEIWISIRGFRRRLLYYQTLAAYAGSIACRPYMTGDKRIKPPFEEE